MLVPVRLAGYMCEVQAPAHHSKVEINAGAVEADRAVLLLYRCAFAGGLLAAGGRSQNND